MLHLIFMATVTFFYQIESGVTYQACLQKVGEVTPACQPMTVAPLVINGLDDDSDYDFWIIQNGTASAKVRAHTKKKDVTPLAIALD